MREDLYGLVLPLVLLGALGWVVPVLLARVFPEGIRPLLLLGLAATLILIALATAAFVLLYAVQGAPLGALFAPGIGAGLAHFLRLGLLSALVWAPLLILSVANLPRGWKEETW